MNNNSNLILKLSMINLYFFIILMVTPLFYWRGAQLEYAIVTIIWLISILIITNLKIPINKLMVIVCTWLFIVLFYRLINYSTASFFNYGKIIFFWLSFIVYNSLYMFYKPSTRIKIGVFAIVVLLINVIQNIFILIYYPNASRAITKASIYYSKFRNLNVGSTSFVFATNLLTFVFLGLLINSNKRRYKFLYLIIITMLIIYQLQAARATSIILMILGFLLFIYLYYFKIEKNIKISISFLLIPIVGVIIYILPDLLIKVSCIISNRYLSQRILDFGLFLTNSNADNLASNRIDLYMQSINVFLEHPIFGAGEHDQFTRVSSIGYHSTFFDTLGNYGILGGLFLIVFFAIYFSKLYKYTRNKNNRIIIFIIAIIFSIYSFLNNVIAHDAIPIIIFIIVPSIFNNDKVGDYYVNIKKTIKI